jgi:hypothetical protein
MKYLKTGSKFLITKEKSMFNKIVVYEALKRSVTSDPGGKMKTGKNSIEQDSLISLLMHDVFGGEILKTHTKKNWHFYNRIDGERVDFARPETQKSDANPRFEDIPSTPDETYDYVDQTDYTNFFMSFVRAFEETVGLDKYKYRLIA